MEGEALEAPPAKKAKPSPLDPEAGHIPVFREDLLTPPSVKQLNHKVKYYGGSDGWMCMYLSTVYLFVCLSIYGSYLIDVYMNFS